MANLCSGNSYLVAKRIEWNKTFKLKQRSVFFSFVYNIIHFLDYSTRIYLHDTIFPHDCHSGVCNCCGTILVYDSLVSVAKCLMHLWQSFTYIKMTIVRKKYVKFEYTNMFCFHGNKFWRHYDVISSKHVGFWKGQLFKDYFWLFW